MKLHPRPYTLYATLLLAFLGFLDSAYLTIQHYKNIIPPCSLAHGCEKVLTSQFASIFGIPTALLGTLFYLAVIFLLILFLETHKKSLISYLSFLISIGALVSLTLILIQIFVLHAICQYCMVSDTVTILIFLVFLKFRKEIKQQEQF